MLSRVKKNDLVMVIAGKDKGKQGRVIAVDRKSDLVKVKGIAIVTRHMKARSAKEQSKIVKDERFIPMCKVMPLCPTTSKPCRIRTKVLADGKKVRVSHRSGEEV